jgi:hypothetical protein
MGKLFTVGVGNLLTVLLGNVLTAGMGKVLDIYNQARVRKSLRTADPKKARWLWEQEYKKEWEKYYGIKADLPSMAITGAVHEDSDVPMVRENAPLKSRPITA